jgi:hypothetical protein
VGEGEDEGEGRWVGVTLVRSIVGCYCSRVE